jgi:hypothetical protein
LAACIQVATHQWFVGDDFAFLRYVQQPEIDWWSVFFSASNRFWWTYRPIGMESYFAIGYGVFGPSYMGFFAIMLGFHLATVVLAHRIARLLGLGAHGAIVVGLVCLSRYAIVDGFYWCSDFFYVSASFFYALSISFFLGFLSSGSRSRQLLSSICFVAALMSCEFTLTLPAILLLLLIRDRIIASPDGWRPDTADLVRAWNTLWPYIAVAAVYVPFRYLVAVSRAQPPLYSYSISGKTVGQALAQIGWISGPGIASAALALLMLATAGLALRHSGARRRETIRHLAPLLAICAVWIVANGLPFIGLARPHPRFSMPLVLPTALMVGALVDGSFRSVTNERKLMLEVATIAGIALSLPYAALARHAAEPASRPARILADTVSALAPEARYKRKMAVMYGGQGMADSRTARRFRIAVESGQLLAAIFPGQRIRFVLAPVGDPRHGRSHCPRCEYFLLLPDYTLVPTARPSH